MNTESDIRNAAHAGQERLWHHKGHYSIIVTSVLTLGGTEWVQYFIEQNCDLTLKTFEDAFMRLNHGGETQLEGIDLMQERHFEDNTMRVMSMARAVEKFRKKKPSRKPVLKMTILGSPPQTAE